MNTPLTVPPLTHTHTRPVNIILSHIYSSSLSVVTSPHHSAVSTVGLVNTVNCDLVSLILFITRFTLTWWWNYWD